VAALTHDQKIDDQAIEQALKRGCFYTGVLGSRKTLGDRKDRLRESGVEESLLDRIDGPVGLDIGAAGPEEIALSVAAQIVQRLRRGR
jgi:xanthine dehydrogenase accessory factor